MTHTPKAISMIDDTAIKALCRRPEFFVNDHGTVCPDACKAYTIVQVLQEIGSHPLRLAYLMTHTTMNAREASDFLAAYGYNDCGAVPL